MKEVTLCFEGEEVKTMVPADLANKPPLSHEEQLKLVQPQKQPFCQALKDKKH